MTRTLQDEAEDQAFSRLFQESLRDLRGFLRRILRHEADTDDIAQEALLRVWKHRDSFGDEAPRPLLFRIARNLALDRLRERRRWPAVTLDEGIMDHADVSAERIVAGRNELALIQHAIEALPDNCRMAFLRCRVEGRSHAEIAAKMGISKSMVEKHMAEAIFRLSRARALGESGRLQ